MQLAVKRKEAVQANLGLAPFVIRLCCDAHSPTPHGVLWTAEKPYSVNLIPTIHRRCVKC